MLKNKKNKSYKQTVYLYTVCFDVYPCEVVCTDDRLRHPELCDFTLASKKACHCEDERSEDVAIAKSLNINEITTSHFVNAPRNDTNREGTYNFPLSPLGRGIEGEGLTKNRSRNHSKRTHFARNQ